MKRGIEWGRGLKANIFVFNAVFDFAMLFSCLLQYGSAYTQMNAMSVRFNQCGTQLVALRRRLPAALYNIHSSVPAVEFNHEGYYNSCTMKSCCFGGDKDQVCTLYCIRHNSRVQIFSRFWSSEICEGLIS